MNHINFPLLLLIAGFICCFCVLETVVTYEMMQLVTGDGIFLER